MTHGNGVAPVLETIGRDTINRPVSRLRHGGAVAAIGKVAIDT